MRRMYVNCGKRDGQEGGGGGERLRVLVIISMHAEPTAPRWWPSACACLPPPPLLLCLSRFCHLPAEITSTGRAGGRMRVGASGYNSRYIAYEIRCLQGWRSHERL